MGDSEPLPIGTHVHWLSSEYGWIGGTVVGHDQSATIVRHNDGYKGCHSHELRLPPTAEQIAAAERKQAIEQMIKDLKAVNGCGFYSIAEDLYDAGYRKVRP